MRKVAILFFLIIYATHITIATSQDVLELPSTEKIITLNPGDIKTFDIFIKNPFNYTLNETTLKISGEAGRWVAVIPNNIESIPANEKAKFTVIMMAPNTASVGVYNISFILKSSTYESTSEQIIINIPKTPSSTEDTFMNYLFSVEFIKEFIRAFFELIALLFGASYGAYYIDRRAKRGMLKKEIYNKLKKILYYLEKYKNCNEIEKKMAEKLVERELVSLETVEFSAKLLHFDINEEEVKGIIDLIRQRNYSEAREKLQNFEFVTSRLKAKISQWITK